MDSLINKAVMNSRDAVYIVRNTLNLVDARLVDHGERVAYILSQMLRNSADYSDEEKIKIAILGVFHDIGAYKTDEIDKMVQFETKDVLSHSIYGYLFLKYFSPLRELSKAVLYHHFDYNSYQDEDKVSRDIGLMINLADRIDMHIQHQGRAFDYSVIENNTAKFDPRHVAMFRNADQNFGVVKSLLDGSYLETIKSLIQGIHFTNKEISQYLDMLVYSIDFRSAYTVTHTINTVAISLAIAKELGFSTGELVKIYYGAQLHDIGKIAMPLEILEFPGKLSHQAMEIMKTHVTITRKIIEGIVDDEVCKIAVRHHEKLDGSGYPEGLTAPQLSPSQRIVAVADIMSALSGKRSYKEAFPKEKILQILGEMSAGGQLCPTVCAVVAKKYDQITAQASQHCDKILETYSNLMVEYNAIQTKYEKRMQKG